MLGPAHSAGGLAGGIIGATVAAPAVLHTTASLETAVIAGIIGSGFGIFADLDTRGKASNSIGVLGAGITKVLGGISRGFYYSTKSSSDTLPPHSDGSHRTMTHLPLFAVLMSALFWLSLSIPFSIILWLSFLATFGISALLPKLQKRASYLGSMGLLVVSIVSSAIYILKFHPTGLLDQTHILGISALMAMLSHLLFDLTKTGVPHPLAPLIKIKGQRWYRVRLPISASSPLANTLLFSLSIGTAIYLMATTYFI